MILDQKPTFSVSLPLDAAAGFMRGKLVVEVFPAAVMLSLVNGDQRFLFFHSECSFPPRAANRPPGSGEAANFTDALEVAKIEMQGHLATVHEALARLNPLALQALVAKVENL